MPTDCLDNYLHSGMFSVINEPESIYPGSPAYYRRGGPGWNEADTAAAQKDYWSQVDAWNGAWNETLQWWEKNAPEIRKTMAKRLTLIKDSKVAKHVARNFEARASHLDDMAKHGVENFGHDDWHRTEVPLYRYDTDDHLK